MRRVVLTVFSTVLLNGCEAARQLGFDSEGQADQRSPNNPRRTRAVQPRETPLAPTAVQIPAFLEEVRTIDGTRNNGQNPAWGAAETPFLRVAAAAYADGISAPSGADRPNPRLLSQLLCAEETPAPNPSGVSDFVWQWGQFLDHDIDLTPEVDPVESFDIAVPIADPWFDPFESGAVVMPFGRSLYVAEDGVRQQVNAITAFIDGSVVYGSDAARATTLRTNDGTGRMRTSAGDLLPFNDAGLDNAAPRNRDPASLFVAGDFRANEQVGLTAVHTLFVREHNRWAEQIRNTQPDLTGEQIFQRARALVAAELQAITYREFLPALLGPDALPTYGGYDASTDPRITNEFATAAYRFGHSMLSPQILRLGSDGRSTPAGPLSLADAFFAPEVLVSTGLEPVMRGLAAQEARAIDLAVVDDVRNLLFGPPGAGGLDLASLNIQRGRDHGLPGFGAVRAAFGLTPPSDFDELETNEPTKAALRTAYESVEQIDPWIGILAETPVRGGLVGPTARAIFVDQFRRLRDGDRFWYEEYLPEDLVRTVQQRTLSRIIRDNTDVGDELPANVFYVSSSS